MTIRWNHAGFLWLIIEIVCNVWISEVSAFPISFLSHHHTSVRFSTSFPTGTSPSTVGPLYVYNEDKGKKNKDSNYGDNDGITEGNSDLLRELEKTYQYDGRLSSGGKDHRCGYVCLVGAPNMGKSTLMNALLETDLSVATSRPQTTRHAILGLMTSPNRQVCLLDTPGVLDEPAYRLQEGMMEAVMGAFHDADCLLIVTDVFSTPIPKDALFRKVQMSSKPVIVVINKVDLFDGALSNRNNGGVNNTTSSTSNELNDGRTHSVQDAVARWRSWLPQALLILPLSASLSLSSNTKKDVNMKTLGVSILRKVLMGESNIPEALRDLGRPIPGMFPSDIRTISDEIARDLLPLGPPLYESDALTDRSERFFASELIRSALFENLRKELPYCCEVRVTKFQEPPVNEKEDNDGKVKSNLIRIHADVIVERDSQKGIVVGKRGSTIRTISIDARAKLEHFFQSPVYLELQVKVENEWRKNEDTLKKFGYLR